MWAGSISVSTALNDGTGRMVYLMLKCHTIGAHPTILICCALKGVGICSDRMIPLSLVACGLHPFLFVLLLLSSSPDISGAFLGSRIMALLEQDYPGIAKAPLQICHFTTLNKTPENGVIQSRFSTCFHGSFRVMTNYLDTELH